MHVMHSDDGGYVLANMEGSECLRVNPSKIVPGAWALLSFESDVWVEQIFDTDVDSLLVLAANTLELDAEEGLGVFAQSAARVRVMPSQAVLGAWALLTLDGDIWVEQICDPDVELLLSIAADSVELEVEEPIRLAA